MGVQVNGFVEVPYGKIQIAQLRKAHPPVVVGIRVFRVEADGNVVVSTPGVLSRRARTPARRQWASALSGSSSITLPKSSSARRRRPAIGKAAPNGGAVAFATSASISLSRRLSALLLSWCLRHSSIRRAGFPVGWPRTTRTLLAFSTHGIPPLLYHYDWLPDPGTEVCYGQGHALIIAHVFLC